MNRAHGGRCVSIPSADLEMNMEMSLERLESVEVEVAMFACCFGGRREERKHLVTCHKTDKKLS